MISVEKKGVERSKYVCMCMCMNVYVHVCVGACMCMCMYVSEHHEMAPLLVYAWRVCVHACFTHIDIHIIAYMYTCVYKRRWGCQN